MESIEIIIKSKHSKLTFEAEVLSFSISLDALHPTIYDIRFEYNKTETQLSFWKSIEKMLEDYQNQQAFIIVGSKRDLFVKPWVIVNADTMKGNGYISFRAYAADPQEIVKDKLKYNVVSS
jgi:hypothetical protein